MALKGTLGDTGIVALLQFPNAGRRTGTLEIDSPEGKAVFYYNEGALVHAELGGQVGRHVLVKVMEWSEGEFQFRPEPAPEENTIEGDLHRLILWALKQKDEEKRKGAVRHSMPSSDPGSMESPELVTLLGQMLVDSKIPRAVLVIGMDGEIVGQAFRDDGDTETLEDAIEFLRAMIASYPGERLEAVSLAASTIRCCLQAFDDLNWILCLLGDPDAPAAELEKDLKSMMMTLESRIGSF